MPFLNEMRPYTKENISDIDPMQNGVYGIFRGDIPIYIGSGDIRDRMLAHINGDNSCITRNTPDFWTATVLTGDPVRTESGLIREYNPL